MKKYSARGYVYGKYWGGGEGAYPSEKLNGYDSVDELLSDANKMLETGGLDSGMGYESLLGAILYITETETKDIDGKIFIHEEQEDHIIGNLTDDQVDFLMNIYD